MQGKVHIVGAGPGAADLLTVRAASLLRAAEVVLHDDLVPQEILDLIAPGAEIINVGKRCGRHGTSQEQIHALMVQFAQQSRNVVRLKSGDPAVFGRLGEELDALREAGIPFEIVPGVTAVTSAAAAGNFTLTDRRAASALVILTAHNCRKQSPSGPLFDPEQATYAIYMPGPDYSGTAHELLRMGLDAATPCAVVSNAGRAQQRIRFLSLSELPSLASVAAPAILVVGKVVRSGELQESTYFMGELCESVRNQVSF
ncbi:MAG TPA: uroporphyrinogen-III C-methyltransferase [Candidatus Angelobacter sp.]|nr:uroporphyrinogen-III C-methyltransferase [Candidatus Angelobacter sp.]